MSEYTPDTEEVRIKYRLASGSGVETPSEFNRWLAEVRATVLEEAADDAAAETTKWAWVARSVADWLRTRAAQIRQETTA